MNTIGNSKDEPVETLQSAKPETVKPGKNEKAEAFAALERGMYAALETYSNVHRGSGHNSMVTTHVYEQAREIVLEYLGLNSGKFTVIFCTPRIAANLKAQTEPKNYRTVSSKDIGLSLGVIALAVKRKALPKGAPLQTGGGTTKLASRDWIIWADAPEKFEAGTPAIINVIAFVRALLMIKESGKDIFKDAPTEKMTASDILYRDDLEKYSGRELLDELRKTMIGRGVLVPTMEGERPFINLDNSASTQTFTPVWDAFRRTWRQPDEVKQAVVREVKSICAGALGAPADAYDLIFTSNTTEAINLAAESLGRELAAEGCEPVVLNTLIEHSSNDLPWRMIPGYSLIRLPVDAEGFLDLNGLDTLICAYNQKGEYGKKRIRLVAVSGASNVLGVCNNIGEISRIVHRYGARLLVDAAQLVAHHKVDIAGCGIDYFAFSAHKVYAPFGCGVLATRKGLLNFNLEELDMIQQSGEENAGGIAALGKTLVLLQRIGLDLIREEEHSLTEKVLHGMMKVPGLKIYGIKDPDTPGFAHKIGVVVFGMKSMMPNRVAKEIALRSRIGTRYGCHCAHILIKHLLKTSPALERLQRLIQTLFPKLRLPGLVRVSLGIGNSEEDVDTLIRVLDTIAGKQQNSVSEGKHILSRSDVQRKMNDFTKAAARRIYS